MIGTNQRLAMVAAATYGGRRARLRRKSGFTLLELILALSLSVVVLMAVGMAVQFHIRTFDSRQVMLEESQLARSILQIIASDIRSVVVHYEQDVSSVQALLSSTGSGQGGQGGQNEEGEGAEGAGVGFGGLEGGNTQSEMVSQTGTTTTETGAEGSLTEDLATTAAIPAMPGIYGNQYQIQVDVSRLPRLDQYQQIFASNPGGELTDVTSDVKTVSYFVQSQSDAATSAALDPLAAMDGELTQGLVRRELDRTVTQWAMTNAAATSLMKTGDLLASEVVGIEFQYFDGIEWRLEWDTQTEEGLPLAIQVLLLMGSADAMANAPPDADGETVNPDLRYYRLVVNLPVATATADESTATTETNEGAAL